MTTSTMEQHEDTPVKPLLAEWAVPARFVPGSSTSIGNDDTGTYRDDTEEADT